MVHIKKKSLKNDNFKMPPLKSIYIYIYNSIYMGLLEWGMEISSIQVALIYPTPRESLHVPSMG